MICATEYQTAVNANADNTACAEMEVNEQALADLFKDGGAMFSNEWFDLGEVIEESLEQDREKFLELMCEVEFAKYNNLPTYTELNQQQLAFYAETVLKMNEMANRH